MPPAERHSPRRAPRRLPPEAAQLLVLGIDALIAALSVWSAMLLRFEGRVPSPYRELLPALALLMACYRVLGNLAFRLHCWSFRFSGLADGARLGLAGFFGTALLLGTIYLMRDPGPPRSVVVMELLLSTLFMAAVRFSPRLAGLYVGDWVRRRRDGTLRTVIVGAGSAGELLLRDLQRSRSHDYQVVGFVDDDRAKRHHVVAGKQVLGRADDLPRLAREHRLAQVLIAIPRLHGRRIREILSLCADLKLRFKILPVAYVDLPARPASTMMLDLAPEDLLPREPVRFAETGTMPPLARRLALVTGAAGSIGSEMCAQLLRAGLEGLVLVDINENGLYLLQRRLEHAHPGARLFAEVADIRDEVRTRSLFTFYTPQDVFHAAAHKHVPLLETAPCEAVKNNVVGTRNVARAAHACGAERFVYVSTDKAVRPRSVMGASKRVGEELVRSMARRSPTRFCAVRFGNVLGSAGSVVPVFLEQIAAGGPVTVTHPEVRRYFMTIEEAAALVLRAAYGDFGELCVLDMGEPIRIADLARNLITMSGLVPDADIPIVYTGLRPGEKLAEELLTEEEERTRRVNDKIFAVDCPPPPDELETALQQLAEAASLELAPRVIELLRVLVPSYSGPGPFADPSASGGERRRTTAGAPPPRARRARAAGRLDEPGPGS
jgi:FlaA1/EpsC-like NDP-sugar epimerase